MVDKVGFYLDSRYPSEVYYLGDVGWGYIGNDNLGELMLSKVQTGLPEKDDRLIVPKGLTEW